jgi:hypothetical protein
MMCGRTGLNADEATATVPRRTPTASALSTIGLDIAKSVFQIHRCERRWRGGDPQAHHPKAYLNRSKNDANDAAAICEGGHAAVDAICGDEV